MGVSYVEYEYPKPYHSKLPLYEMNGKPLKYVSTPEDKDETQPFRTVPWTAEFRGCCRMFPGISSTAPLSFVIKTTVDLSNHVASPRLVSMPYLYVKSGAATNTPICALSAGGKSAMVRKNGGTINYPGDDNSTATFSWTAKGSSIVIVGQGRCALVTIGNNPAYRAGERDSITIEVKMGDALVTGEYTVKAQGPEILDMKDKSRAPFGCPSNAVCEGILSLGKMTPIFTGSATYIDFESVSNTALEVRYIVATSSRQSTLVSTSQGTVQYSLTEAGEDHAELPYGAKLAPVNAEANGGSFITNLDVIYSADEQNSRPRQQQAFYGSQRDYSGTMKTDPSVWFPVAGTNFNAMSGGAHITVYMEKGKLRADDITDHRHMAAITEIDLATPDKVASFLQRGFLKLEKNLLEQSNRGEIYIMYKKGSGPPLLDLSSTPKPGYVMISASTSNSQARIATATLYASYSQERRVSRSLIWSPCTGQDKESEIVICMSVHAW
jgi:hypothetical protein